jgi:hypothetical protein
VEKKEFKMIRMFRNGSALALLASTIIACSNSYYSKPGVTDSTLENDEYECEIQALDQVPPNQKTYTNSYTGQVYSIDDNESLRDKAFKRCMKSNGYILITD